MTQTIERPSSTATAPLNEMADVDPIVVNDTIGMIDKLNGGTYVLAAVSPGLRNRIVRHHLSLGDFTDAERTYILSAYARYGDGVPRHAVDLDTASVEQVRYERTNRSEALCRLAEALGDGMVTPEEFSAEADRIGGLPMWPAGYTLGPCPDWCDRNHTEAERDQFERSEGDREHVAVLARIEVRKPDNRFYPDGLYASVEVSVFDDLNESKRGRAVVLAQFSSDEVFKRGSDARAYGLALVQAADLADAFNAEQFPGGSA